RDPGRVRGPLLFFRSAYGLTPEQQRNYPGTFITPGTGIQSWSTRTKHNESRRSRALAHGSAY
ncbi:MAG: hypothetical protein AB7G28_12570, partial [Pirellulales bacterium]